MNSALVEHLDLCAALAAGSLDPADRAKFADHLAEGCDDCEQVLPGYHRATVLIAAALPLSAPAPALRDRVLAAAASLQPPPSARLAKSTSRRGPAFSMPPATWAVFSGAFLFVALAAAGVAWYYASEVGRLRREIATGTEMIAGLNEQLQDAKLWGELYTLPETRTAMMRSTPRSDVTLRARAIYDARSQRALMVFNDLRAPRGRVYQLWSIEGPRFTSLGVLETDEQGRAIVRVEQAGDPNRLTEFGVSLEHEGGSPNAAGPTGPLVMVGKVEG